MTADYEAIKAHEHTIQQVIPLLEAIRSVAEIAFRRAEERLPPLARYAERIGDQLAALNRQSEGWFGNSLGLPARSVIVVITSERALCGTFNQRLIDHLRADLKSRRSAGEDIDLICLGRQGQRLLQAANEPVIHWSPLSSFALPAYLDIEKAAIDILDLMEARHCSALFIMNNAPQRRFQFQVTRRQLLPLAPFPPSTAGPVARLEVKPASDTEALSTQLVTEQMLVNLYQAVIESAISEELARVAAMRLATDNARHLLEQLTQDANRVRQVTETNALLEIMGGFQAASPGEGI